MKKRTGFVSNSSSSSFCIFGVALDEKEAKELLIKNCKNDELLADVDKWGVQSGIDSKKYRKGLQVLTGDPEGYDDYIYVGASWDSIKDDETGAQFKERVREIIVELFGDVVLGTYEESWYNG